MRYRYVAAITLVVILGIGGWFWAVRRGAETTGEPAAIAPVELQRGLVGYWKLQGDCRDYSGREHHGTNHGVDLQTSSFDGRGAYVEVPAREPLHLGRGDFTFSAWVHTDRVVDDTLGDVLSWYDPQLRRGVTLNLHSSAGGYQSTGDDRHVCFGIDNARLGEWQDCGRPSPTSNYVSNSLTVYDGHLYAATIDAQDEAGWCHVYRYAGGKEWVDCGRVGQRKTTGVMALMVHQGHLYAGTSTYDWTRVFSGKYEPSRVYRYDGGTQWIDCGQPGQMLRINCLATYGGKLYAGGDRGLPPPGENNGRVGRIRSLSMRVERSGVSRAASRRSHREASIRTRWPCMTENSMSATPTSSPTTDAIGRSPARRWGIRHTI